MQGASGSLATVLKAGVVAEGYRGKVCGITKRDDAAMPPGRIAASVPRNGGVVPRCFIERRSSRLFESTYPPTPISMSGQLAVLRSVQGELGPLRERTGSPEPITPHLCFEAMATASCMGSLLPVVR